MASYFLHRRQPRRRWWYLVSLLMFALGVAGKLSVVVVPAVFFVFDLLVERRRSWGMVLDKIPYGLKVAAWFALRAVGAQPATRQELDLYVIGHSTLQNLWLLTGLGNYVMARPRPDLAASGGFRLLCLVLPLAIAVAPWFLRRRVPGLTLSLVYWILLALVPSQVLSFVHPVADRYLFFPSVGAVLLFCWLGQESSLRHPGSLGLLAPDANTRDLPLHEQVDHVIQASGLAGHYEKDKADKGEARLENLEELVSAARGFEPEDSEMSPLASFLSHAVLESGEGQAEAWEDCVQMMTLHSAKGLEFPMVFLCGMEDGLFPHQRSITDVQGLEEERRLCYVGITRAMRHLYVTYAEQRRMHGVDRLRRTVTVHRRAPRPAGRGSPAQGAGLPPCVRPLAPPVGAGLPVQSIG